MRRRSLDVAKRDLSAGQISLMMLELGKKHSKTDTCDEFQRVAGGSRNLIHSAASRGRKSGKGCGDAGHY